MDQIFGSEQLTGALRTVSLTAAISWKPREKVTISDRPGNDLPETIVQSGFKAGITQKM